MRQFGFLAVAAVMAVAVVTGCSTSGTPSAPSTKPSPPSSTKPPSAPPAKTRAEVTADLRAAGQGLGTYTDLTPRLLPGACMVTSRRLSRRTLTMRDARLAAERLQQRGWKLGRAKPEGISLTSGAWLAALATATIPDNVRATKLAPYKAGLVLTAMGKCPRR